MSSLPVPPDIAKIAPDGNLTPRQKRRILIEMSLRKQKPGTGSGHEFMRRRTAMHPWPDLRSILDGVDWVLIGGVATRAYMPERVTKDMDILVRQADGEDVVGRLKRAGYTVVSKLAVPGYLLQSPEGVELDILFGKSRWLDEALAHPEHDAAGYPVIGLPYLVMLKMAVNRGRDLGDLTTMLGWASDEALAKIREVVARYSPEDSGDLESLIFIGKKEQETPSQAE